MSFSLKPYLHNLLSLSSLFYVRCMIDDAICRTRRAPSSTPARGGSSRTLVFHNGVLFFQHYYRALLQNMD